MRSAGPLYSSRTGRSPIGGPTAPRRIMERCRDVLDNAIMVSLGWTARRWMTARPGRLATLMRRRSLSMAFARTFARPEILLTQSSMPWCGGFLPYHLTINSRSDLCPQKVVLLTRIPGVSAIDCSVLRSQQSKLERMIAVAPERTGTLPWRSN